ncbi:23S rRNA (adenine(2503)-C(2))-methyltransferase RlmN [Opitutus terrae]|uniref:Probable dual-specificity RNA methyltransferase RlmN 3 n=1 Tax=Opitutus terrae (strain DSM 11246 / JCM 15787 / PB90-1) TaxID=452637 RepID=RLMN3_OPITP|nr:23S rRNA (adenine(2503)-C(2))-methyltransferase RlmN [Opitutus terrae]B2A0B9.1 RecName: Full=Probable dual-specificity RNA methyltransferase RlmN 3; AltName: Full=23S rRNA (adenine(2503)-C(2))-methyltransferase 3; AltName: Full=23S rRNA m2A2503 methyltransferase 3; AltName: Full=Ribosomal RNA large subunit methyltransferase N 3; AltName: Full=tRNA (adenine(37)-C(2))-methyltransferase 3; AltName: Full=tRNA m2A37 methyltransferase 3 [Opitutus terrae PB90-1]ACB77455.1 radical SAM enzyme, Cfr fami
MKFTPAKPPLTGETLESLTARLRERGEPAFRASQILDWVYKKRARSWDGMTNLPKPLRTWLDDTFDLMPATLVLNKQSADVTDKLLLELRDGSLIETVIIRAPQEGVGQDHSRKTICISTQVGCAMGCVFCASGLAGLKRDLSAGEIVAQLLQVCYREDALTPRAHMELASFDNIVVMGMGEPLANYDALIRALTILNADWGLGFGARRITVSTSGLVPKILQLADEPLGFRLAISLHGATDEVREKIMPVNKAFPLAKLLPAVKAFSEKHGRMITLEFILIDGVNDSLEQAEKLRDIALDLHAHVNLIPYNTVEGLAWKRPSITRQERFADVLRARRVSVTLRREKGHDIDAACGQLRLKTEKERQVLAAAKT